MRRPYDWNSNNMADGHLLLTSAVSVVTASTSLITVPAMLQFHLEPRMALATNTQIPLDPVVVYRV
jgi:hypothetical protein